MPPLVNAFLDGGFEDAGNPAHNLSGFAAFSTDEAQEGAQSLAMEVTADKGFGPTTINHSSYTQDVQTTIGVEYTIQLQAHVENAIDSAGWSQRVEVLLEDPAAVEPPILLGEFGKELGSGWNLVALGTHVATKTSTRVRFQTDVTEGGNGIFNGTIYLDAVLIGRPVLAFTKQLRQALEADLADITTGNGFSQTVLEVGHDVKPVRSLQLPAAIIEGADGESDATSLTNIEGSAEQTFHLFLAVRDEDWRDALEDLVDDVANAVERSAAAGGNLQAISGVDDVTLVRWEETATAEEISNHYGTAEAVVQVEYHYSRGSR